MRLSKQSRSRASVAVTVGCATLLLSSCAVASGGAADSPDIETSQAASAPGDSDPDYGYLAAVDDQGLINGKTVSQLSGEFVSECLRDSGWVDTVLGDDGTITANYPPEQAVQYQDAFENCSELVAAKYPTPILSDRAIRERYGYELQTRECLIAQGYSVSEPPSEQVWVDAFQNAGSGGLWLPYFELFTQNAITAEEEAGLKKICPDPANRFYRQ